VVQDRVQWLPLTSAVPLSKIWLINKMYFCEIGDDGRLMELTQASISMADFVISSVQTSASVIIVD